MNVLPAEVESGGVTLRGERWCGDDAWLVFAHDRGRDLDDWRPLQSLVERRGRSALVLDLRGHGGSDDGKWDPDADLAAALEHVRSLGASVVTIVAAGESALAALRVSADILVLLSPSPEGDLHRLRVPGVPRVFLYGSRDDAVDRAVATLRRVAIGWAGSVAFPTSAQGAELLEGEWALQALDRIGSFLDEQLYLATP
jgi:pimeloyl-ACP methyl ester carboxylesterase